MSIGSIGSKSQSGHASRLTLHVSRILSASLIASACSAAVPVVPPDVPQVLSIVTLRAPGGQVLTRIKRDAASGKLEAEVIVDSVRGEMKVLENPRVESASSGS